MFSRSARAEAIRPNTFRRRQTFTSSRGMARGTRHRLLFSNRSYAYCCARTMGETAPVTVIHNKTFVFANIFSSTNKFGKKNKTTEKKRKRKENSKKKRNFKRDKKLLLNRISTTVPKTVE